MIFAFYINKISVIDGSSIHGFKWQLKETVFTCCTTSMHYHMPFYFCHFHFQNLKKWFPIPQDSHQLSSCPPGCSGYRVRNVYCAQRLLQAHLCSSSRRHDWFGVMQIADRWKCRLGWGGCLGYLSGCNRL